MYLRMSAPSAPCPSRHGRRPRRWRFSVLLAGVALSLSGLPATRRQGGVVAPADDHTSPGNGRSLMGGTGWPVCVGHPVATRYDYSERCRFGRTLTTASHRGG